VVGDWIVHGIVIGGMLVIWGALIRMWWKVRR
jgi:hypothetical protein